MDEELEALAKHLAHERMQAESDKLLRWTKAAVRPLYAPDDAGDPEHVGSSVLVRIHNRCFVATAAHVLDSVRPNESVYLRTVEGDFCELVGERVSSVGRRGLRIFDKIDIGFIALADECLPALSSCRFLTVDEMCIDDLADYTPVTGSKYLALGYPHQLAPSGPHAPRAVPWTGNPRRVSTSGAREVIEESHVFLEMDLDLITRELGLQSRLDPTGMSGGGLFKFGSLVRGADGRNCLAGILIEKHVDSAGGVLATRLSLLTEGIRAAFPALDAYIPRPRTVRVNATLDGRTPDI